MNFLIIIGNSDFYKIKTGIELAGIALKRGNNVRVAFLNCYPDINVLDLEDAGLKQTFKDFLKSGGEFYTCAKSIVLEKTKNSGAFPIENIERIYELVVWADKLIEIW